MSTHPTLARYRAIVSAAGSTATTARGVLNYLRNSMRPRTVQPFGSTRSNREYAIQNWKLGGSARKADPDAKRARDDTRFRRNYLAGLRRRERAALEFDGAILSGLLARIDSKDKRVAELAEVARLRTIATGKTAAQTLLPKISADSHPLRTIPIDQTTARKVGADINMRGIAATLAPCVAASHGHHEEAYTDWSKGSSKPRGVRAVHDNFVRSFGLIVSPTRLEAVFHRTQTAVELPDGYIWDRDANGLRAVDATSRRDDYHPDAAELLRKDAAAYIVGKINANRARRAEMAARVAVEAAAVKGVFVCLADSIRAGNCRAGTLAFGQRHGLDPARHYTAPELLEIANGDGSRVRLAVTAARLRHEREERQGFCEISEHRA